MKKLLFLSLSFLTSLCAKNVYLVPVGGHDENKLFFDPYAYRDECGRLFCALREALIQAGYQVKFTWDAQNLRDVAAIISFGAADSQFLTNLRRYPKGKCFLFIFESPIWLPELYSKNLIGYFGRVYTLSKAMVDGNRFFLFHYPQPRLEMIEGVYDFSEKKLCAMIASAKTSSLPESLYRERFQVIEFFTHQGLGDFDLYGPGWEGTPNWRGIIPGKWEVLKQYRFSFCYENVGNTPGYLTEKIFDSMVAGCVPIYWGAPDITDYVPKGCFIDRRDFATTSDVYQFIKAMDQETYEGYLKEIRTYLAGPQAKLFSIDHFVDTVLSEIKAIEVGK